MVAAVLLNHLGLIVAVEGVISKVVRREVRFHIINCSKCLSFWATVVFVATKSRHTVLELWEVVMLPPVMAYAAWWTELFLGWLSTLYDKAYDEIYSDAGHAYKQSLPAEREGHSGADFSGDTYSEVPDVY